MDKQKLIAKAKMLTTAHFFPNSKTLSNLDSIADDSLLLGTIQGNLAAILIHHQLSEELIKSTLDYAYTFANMTLYPHVVERDFESRRLMFGQLLTELKSAPWFEQKDGMIDYARKINEDRIEVVHKIGKDRNYQKTEQFANNVKTNYELLFQLAINAIQGFSTGIKHQLEVLNEDK